MPRGPVVRTRGRAPLNLMEHRDLLSLRLRRTPGPPLAIRARRRRDLAEPASSRRVDVSHSWAATNVAIETEEGRAFFQARLALLGQVGFLLSAIFYAIVRVTAREVLASTNPEGAGQLLLQFGHQLLFLGTWLVCRRGRLPLAALRAI